MVTKNMTRIRAWSVGIATFSCILFCQGCFLATYRGTINAPPSEAYTAMIKAVKKIDYDYTEGPLDFWVRASLNTGYGYLEVKSQFVPGAAMLIQKHVMNAANNTSTHGAVVLKPHADSTEYTGTFASEAGDPFANARFIYEITNQQLRMDAGTLAPVVNPDKSIVRFIGASFISPVLGARYLEKGNPLISSKFKKLLYGQNAIGDLLMVPLLAAGAVTGNNDLNIAGISCGIIWRLFVLIQITDLNDYNQIAQSGFHLDF